MTRSAKMPPFLLLAALLFWGWQSKLPLAGAIMGLALESARLVPERWDLTWEDFRRIRNFCMLLALALALYVFATNQTGGGLTGLAHAGTLAAARFAGDSATTLLRWLPMTFFLLMAAQKFSERECVPLSALWFRRRRNKGSAEAESGADISYAYFMVCLFSAGIHANDGRQTYFWGLAALLAWALWPLRPRRFAAAVWAGALAGVIGLGLSGQRGIAAVQRALAGYNAEWMANLARGRTDPTQSATALGQVGKLKLSPRIVIRLETRVGRVPPDYLREASYRHYQPQQKTWFSGSSPADFTPILHEPGDETAWQLVPGKTNTPAVTIASYLDGRSKETGDPEGLLPLPSGSSRLENLRAFTLKMNKGGAVLASGLGLVIFDAHYGPGATLDSPPDGGAGPVDLTVPPEEVPALEQVISEMKIPGATQEQKLLAVRQFFSAKFSYSTWLGPEKAALANETALSRFLLQSRSGHCEYFATATVLLLRQLGIPARYAVGYYVHEPSGRGWVVRERDAHAWCLVWNGQAQIWQDLDTTPASWVAEEAKRASVSQWLSDFGSWLRFQIAKFRWGQANLRQYILWALVPLLALLLYQILFRRGRRRRLGRQSDGAAAAILWPGLDSEFYLLERKLAARGAPRQPGEALSDWLTRPLADPALAGLQKPLLDLLKLHYRHRFDPRGLSAAEREALARETRSCLERLAQMV
jgi:transglutaminase-like putative cysteine protease